MTLNGRFLGRPVTGVDRVAIELTRAIGDVLAELGSANGSLTVAIPPGEPARIDLTAECFGRQLPIKVEGRRGGHAWEQLILARYRPRDWLLNMCNTAPILRRRQMVLIHDAQFISHPDSYSLAFRTWYRILLSLLGRRAAAIFTVSHASRTMLEQYGVVPQGKAHVIRLGVDHIRRLEADATISERLEIMPHSYVLAIGSLARHKNIARLVKAFVAADLPGVRLIIAGGGNPTIFRAAGLPTARNVEYIGRVSDAELKWLYGNAMAFACPSLSEGFGLPPLEAMSTGCPVIATTGGAVPEVCGDAACYADPLDTVAWTTALRRIALDENFRTDLARRSLERATAFTWDHAARQVLAELAGRDGATALQARLIADITPPCDSVLQR
ncbi:glycosyltransferase family 4 protein [Sphingomonas sp. CFBP 13728]|uniref:glycosyltransferase family 4 protein n=1 Tax=Sphingomonas sp. CFBP 13728 TaxID=2775294 RepID=UPI0017855385|nr:glycosyltransferase family 1 protein [Sphingomonas sp. CFBP 13728]MBD8621106.1 glycosyltransferase family 4 protein [Sphingomonas sp. CFBP 13728]